MSRTHPPRLPPLILLALCGWTLGAAAQPLGTAFTYQGQLTESGQPANGLYDLQFCLFDSPGTPVTLACAPDFNDVPVETGQFTVALDFGATPFNGQQRWLELRVRPGAGTAGYTILAPRQLIRAVPEALRASVASAAPWAGLTGVPPGFADGLDDTGSGGTVTSVTAGTGLSGGTITGSGTIGIANGGVGLAQINTSQVQARIGNGCSVGQYIRAVNADGTPVCDADATGGSGTVTRIVAGAGLSGGVITTTGTIAIANSGVGLAQIDPTQVQARISGACVIGEYFRGVNADGSVICEPVPGVPRITVVDDPNNPVGTFSSIAIGADGLPVISYHDTTAGSLKVAKCANAACAGPASITTVDDPPSNNVEQFTSIAIRDDGLPVISYYHGTAGALKVARCANPACTGVSTITTVDDPPGSNVGLDTSIAIGADGRPVVSYYDETGDALKVAQCANADYTVSAVITAVDDQANNVGSFSSIAIGADGLPVISYYDATFDALKVARCANAACTGTANIRVVEDPTNDVGQFSSIAIGSGGFPIISYYDATAQRLKVASCNDAGCVGAATITTVDGGPSDSVGTFTSIAVGPDGLPVIAYRDAVAQSVKVARCANSACSGAATITTVDDPANLVGQHVSLAIGADNLPVISYRDSTAGALKVAKCASRGCQ